MKRILVWVILMCCFAFAHAQITSDAQPGYKLVFEKTYLHTDRDIYAPGDTLWFKAYLVNAQGNKLTNSSNNLYVDLISTDAKILKSILIRLDGGTGIGDIDLPDSLVAGTYRLRAYTNWMRNFGNNFIFEKTIDVLEDKTETVTPIVAVNKKTPTRVNAAANTPVAIPVATVNFFPEGGSLIEGINSIVAVKAGDGKPVIGTVISSVGDTVAHFTCDSLGMGMFALLPLKGQYYRAVVKGISYPLQLALGEGLALQVRHTDSLLRIVISRSDTSFKSAILTVKHAGTTVLSQQVELSAAQVAAKILATGLPEGISAITLYDRRNRPQCERLVYIHHPAFSSPFAVKTDKLVYGPKEEVKMVITADPNTSLSLAVADAATIDIEADNIASNLMLSSELPGRIEHPARYFDTTNVNRFKQLDMLLMTQGWRDFVWRRLADTAIRISYAGEKNVVVSGKIEDEVTHKSMAGLFVALRAEANKGDKLFDAVTDAAGDFAITGLNLYGKQSVNLTSTSQTKRTGNFVMDSLSRPAIKPIVKTTALREDTIAEAAIQKRTTAIKKAKLKGVIRLKEVKIKGSKNVMINSGSVLMPWGPDQLFNITPKDYQYKTLQWFLVQTTKGAQISTVADTYGVVYPGVDTLTLPSGMVISKFKLMSPMIFVNGRELNMRDHIMAETYRNEYYNLPLEKFEKIELKHMIGGLHSIKPPDANDPKSTSKFLDFPLLDFYLLYLTLKDNYTMDNPGLKTATIDGYYQARTFYQPPPGAKPQLADYRTTIHWEPNIKTDATGKATVSFYNTVPQTDVRIIVQGVTDKGVPVSTTAGYTIK